MPRLKTNRSAAKRFSRTARGRFKKKLACTSHIMTKKSRNRKRRLRGTSVVSPVEQSMLRKVLPYA
jgi:large subunit ribosomal protein L35